MNPWEWTYAPDGLLNVSDVAELRGYTEEAIRSSIRAGRLPAQMIGRGYKILAADAVAPKEYKDPGPRSEATKARMRDAQRARYLGGQS